MGNTDKLVETVRVLIDHKVMQEGLSSRDAYQQVLAEMYAEVSSRETQNTVVEMLGIAQTLTEGVK